MTISGNEFGALLGALSAACFGGTNAILSLPLVKYRSLITSYITIVVGIVAVVLVALVAGQIQLLFSAPVIALAFFAASGVLYFGMFRVLFFNAIKHIGANQSSILIPTSVLYSFILAFIFLGESLTVLVVAGGLLVVLGASLVEGRSSAALRKGNLKVGLASGLLSALFASISFVLTKAGLTLFPYFSPAIVVGYVAGLIFDSFLVRPQTVAKEIRKMPRSALLIIGGAGLTSALANLLQYGAERYAPVVIVVPLIQFNPVLTILFTWIAIRSMETFHTRTFLGVACAVAGAIIVTIGSA